MERHGRSVTGMCFFVLVLVLCTVSTHEALAQQGLAKIDENIYSYVGVKQSGPQNSFGANAGIVVGSNSILVIDTLISSKEAKRLMGDIKAVSNQPIRFVVNTHYHLDHAFGNSEFEKLGATIIGHEDDKMNSLRNSETVLKNIQGYGLKESDMEGTVIAHPSLTFSDRMQIDLGGQTVQLIHVKPSHTAGSILVYIPNKKVLFSGDVLFTDFHPFMAVGDLKGWMKVLDYILAMDVETIIPGHGPISGKDDIRDMKNYLKTFDRKARQLSAKSADIEYVASEMKKALPQRAEGEWLIKANLQMRYMKK